MKKDLEKRLDSVYTRLLMRGAKLILERSSHLAEIYGNITPISRKLTARRHWFVSHCFRDKSQIMSDLILQKLPSHRKGKRPLNYIDAVSRDTNIGYSELPTAVSDRTYWRNFCCQHSYRLRLKEERNACTLCTLLVF